MRHRLYDTPYIPHPILDNACVLDAECVRHSYNDVQDLLDDMRNRDMTYLALHYPEYTFGFRKGPGKPPGHVHCVSVKGGYRYADWRVT